MKSLVYLSPVPWASFAQRPHKFAEWFHAATGGRVLWVDPYPTRLPRVQDVGRLLSPAHEPAQSTPDWMQVLRVSALPIEPLPGAVRVNRRLWRAALAKVARFAVEESGCQLVIGKPSHMAIDVLRSCRFERTVYDAMDDFPSFHAGLSRSSLARTERKLAKESELTLVSSTRLANKFKPLSRAVTLARNACDPATLPPVGMLAGLREADLVGYVGTIASWFDWELVTEMAAARPGLRFRLTGPVHGSLPSGLPANVELRPACSHDDAMREMARFAVGLIPFRLNPLTRSVDPVKYYEYRALGVPVVSSAFGEMPFHAYKDPGVLLANPDSGAAALERAMHFREPQGEIEAFRERNSWTARFSGAFQGPQTVSAQHVDLFTSAHSTLPPIDAAEPAPEVN